METDDEHEQPTCERCGQKDVVLVVSFDKAEAELPVVDGQVVMDDEKWKLSTEARKFLRCRVCGHEWADLKGVKVS